MPVCSLGETRHQRERDFKTTKGSQHILPHLILQAVFDRLFFSLTAYTLPAGLKFPSWAFLCSPQCLPCSVQELSGSTQTSARRLKGRGMGVSMGLGPQGPGSTSAPRCASLRGDRLSPRNLISLAAARRHSMAPANGNQLCCSHFKEFCLWGLRAGLRCAGNSFPGCYRERFMLKVQLCSHREL